MTAASSLAKVAACLESPQSGNLSHLRLGLSCQLVLGGFPLKTALANGSISFFPFHILLQCSGLKRRAPDHH